MAESNFIKPSNNFRDLSGQRFGKLVAVSYVSPRKWLCICECGNSIIALSSNIVRGNTSSCGCHRKELMTTHGLTGTKEYMAWQSAKGRCFNQKDQEFHNYGGRGITMCEEWRNSFERFLQDMGICPPGHSLDRVNNDGDYTSSNCRWTDSVTQNRNKRETIFLTHDGHTRPLKEWAEHTGIPYDRLFYQYKHGRDAFAPPRRRGKKTV